MKIRALGLAAVLALGACSGPPREKEPPEDVAEAAARDVDDAGGLRGRFTVWSDRAAVQGKPTGGTFERSARGDLRLVYTRTLRGLTDRQRIVQDYEVLIVGGETYVRSPSLVLPAGRTWARLSRDQRVIAPGLRIVDPALVLRGGVGPLLQPNKVGDARISPPVSYDPSHRRFEASWFLELDEPQGESLKAWIAEVGSPGTMNVKLTVDATGRLLLLAVSATAGDGRDTSIESVYETYGAPVEIAPPPADQVSEQYQPQAALRTTR